MSKGGGFDAGSLRLMLARDSDTAVADRVLCRMQRRFEWPQSSAGFRVVARWDSRTAALYHCVGDRAADWHVVLKIGHGWDSRTARDQYEQARWVRHVVGASAADASVVHALGWDDSPPSFAMEFVPGTALGSVLKEAARHRGTVDPEAVMLLRRAGAWVGRFHATTAVSPEDGREAERKARRHLRYAPRLVRFGRASRSGGPPNLKTALSLLDFGPSNAIVRPDRSLCIVDLPGRQELRVVHYDVARFLLGLYKHWPTQLLSPTGRPAAVRAFLEGYGSTGPTTLSAAFDRHAVRAYFRLLCTVGAYRAATWRRGRSAVRQAGWAIRGLPVPRAVGSPDATGANIARSAAG